MHIRQDVRFVEPNAYASFAAAAVRLALSMCPAANESNAIWEKVRLNSASTWRKLAATRLKNQLQFVPLLPIAVISSEPCVDRERCSEKKGHQIPDGAVCDGSKLRAYTELSNRSQLSNQSIKGCQLRIVLWLRLPLQESARP